MQNQIIPGVQMAKLWLGHWVCRTSASHRIRPILSAPSTVVEVSRRNQANTVRVFFFFLFWSSWARKENPTHSGLDYGPAGLTDEKQFQVGPLFVHWPEKKIRRCRGSNPGRPRDRREYSPLYYNDLAMISVQ